MDAIHFAVPAFLVLIIIEALVGFWRGRYQYEMRDAAASMALFAGNAALVTALKAFDLAVFAAFYEYRLFEIGFTPAGWLACFVAIDVAYYWFHRANHEVRFFWAAHVNHHSSEEYNFTTALRQSWTTPLTKWAFFMPLPLLGFHPMMLAIAGAFSTIYGFWTHTRHIGDLGVFEKILVTPSHHRVHHGSNPEYLDRNYANMFIGWDKLFGTFEPERSPVRFGLTKNIHTYNPIRIAFHEWVDMVRDVVDARRPGDALRYLLGRPGWRPDGYRITPREASAGARVSD